MHSLPMKRKLQVFIVKLYALHSSSARPAIAYLTAGTLLFYIFGTGSQQRDLEGQNGTKRTKEKIFFFHNSNPLYTDAG